MQLQTQKTESEILQRLLITPDTDQSLNKDPLWQLMRRLEDKPSEADLETLHILFKHSNLTVIRRRVSTLYSRIFDGQSNLENLVKESTEEALVSLQKWNSDKDASDQPN
jgi:hypothetical protein